MFPTLSTTSREGLEWIRIYTPGPWQPVATATLGRAPDHASTYREWRRAYHFDVYLPRDSTGGSATVSYASYYVWEFRDWNTRGYQCLGVPHGNAGGLLTCLFSVAVRTWMPATCIVHMIVDEFSRINADIDIDIMTAYMKDQYFGDVDMLH